MTTLDTSLLFELHLELGAIDTVGRTPYGQRVIGNLGGGRFEGARLRGTVLPSGGYWGLFTPDGTLSVDGRMCLRTDDGVLIYAVYAGRWAITPETMAQLATSEQIAKHDPSDYYLRIHFLFETETSSGPRRYDWLNRLIAVGSGRRVADGIDYSVFEIL